MTEKTVIYAGRHIDFVMRGRWEYAARKNLTGIVGILAVTDDGKLVLCEQYRPPLDCHVIEVPAGIAGDLDGQRGESPAEAGRRELLEETGYQAERMEVLFEGVPSSGICDEVITMLKATGLRRIGPGGGDAHEQITVHEVPLASLLPWLAAQTSAGKRIDMKIYAALYFCGEGGR